MSQHKQSWYGNVMTMGVTLALCFLVAEFVVFRHILVPDDVLPNVTAGGVVRYVPGTTARFRHPDGRTSLVTINRDGWNSTKPIYDRAPKPGTTRIAVIGDSYVHGAFINTNQGFPEVLEQNLNRRGQVPVEVLRFGMDGAPLSQYLHMLRNEVVQFKPDVVVVQLIHNDFDESFRFLKTRYASSFLKLKQEADGSVTEIPPTPFRAGLADSLRSSATFRYIYYETNLYLKLKSIVSKHFWGGNEVYEPEFISSAVDIRKLEDMEKIQFFTGHIMEEMKKIAQQEGFKLVFAMDGVREAIYDNKSPASYKIGQLNVIAKAETSRLSLPFIDLQETFKAHFQKHKRRFEYSYDWHWNAEGNKLVAQRIADHILANPELLKTRTLINAAALHVSTHKSRKNR